MFGAARREQALLKRVFEVSNQLSENSMASEPRSPKISIVTVVFNNVKTIGDTLDSVAAQDHDHIEHIVIDGNSTDGTSELLGERREQLAHYVCEPDQGIYDAMNKGIALATGDYVGVLNADDFLEGPSTISLVARAFREKPTDCLYGDVRFVSHENPERFVRYYSSRHFRPNRFANGLMPAHPTFYVRRTLYESLGNYKTDFQIAADYELLVRFLLVHGISSQYIPQPLVRMRTGGVSNASWKTYWTLNREVVRACRENGVRTSLPRVLTKYFIKLLEFLPSRQLAQNGLL